MSPTGSKLTGIEDERTEGIRIDGASTVFDYTGCGAASRATSFKYVWDDGLNLIIMRKERDY